jgi:hypothetical protein
MESLIEIITALKIHKKNIEYMYVVFYDYINVLEAQYFERYFITLLHILYNRKTIYIYIYIYIKSKIFHILVTLLIH